MPKEDSPFPRPSHHEGQEHHGYYTALVAMEMQNLLLNISASHLQLIIIPPLNCNNFQGGDGFTINVAASTVDDRPSRSAQAVIAGFGPALFQRSLSPLGVPIGGHSGQYIGPDGG